MHRDGLFSRMRLRLRAPTQVSPEGALGEGFCTVPTCSRRIPEVHLPPPGRPPMCGSRAAPGARARHQGHPRTLGRLALEAGPPAETQLGSARSRSRSDSARALELLPAAEEQRRKWRWGQSVSRGVSARPPRSAAEPALVTNSAGSALVAGVHCAVKAVQNCVRDEAGAADLATS